MIEEILPPRGNSADSFNLGEFVRAIAERQGVSADVVRRRMARQAALMSIEFDDAEAAD